MQAASGRSALWAEANVWPLPRKSPIVVVLGGINHSHIVDMALADTTLTDVAMIRFEPTCTPPCDTTLWRLETASGEGVNSGAFFHRHWHRTPYAVTLRLVQYTAGSTLPEVLDEGTIGTRIPRAAFATAVERLAMRFVRDAVRGRGRGPASVSPAATARGLPGWINQLHTRWHRRLMTEWWSLGTTSTPLHHVLAGGQLGAIRWYNPQLGERYLADPFPWFGSDRILCEEMPLTNGVGRIVAVAENNGQLSAPMVILDDHMHHSYPCTLAEGDTLYCVPESTRRGTTRIHALDEDGTLVPVCDVAPHAALADPTLFRWGGRYWLGCTDLDLGDHDNLCLFHADEMTGPWTPHAKWPVKIDVRGARPAGMVFNAGGRLFRPGQDCAATYGAAIAIHEIQVLTETEFNETLATVLWPDRNGPFPHGLHTLVHDGERFWVDGKRFVLDLAALRQKMLGRVARSFSGSEVA